MYNTTSIKLNSENSDIIFRTTDTTDTTNKCTYRKGEN